MAEELNDQHENNSKSFSIQLIRKASEVKPGSGDRLNLREARTSLRAHDEMQRQAGMWSKRDISELRIWELE